MGKLFDHHVVLVTQSAIDSYSILWQDSLYRKIDEWCRDTLLIVSGVDYAFMWTRDEIGELDEFVISFKNSEHAMLFRLTWMI
jgi:hypothetical protein